MRLDPTPAERGDDPHCLPDDGTGDEPPPFFRADMALERAATRWDVEIFDDLND